MDNVVKRSFLSTVLDRMLTDVCLKWNLKNDLEEISVFFWQNDSCIEKEVSCFLKLLVYF